MFTDDDVNTIFQLFPPHKSSEFLPSLILSSGGHGFVTLQFVQAQFRDRVTKETQRLFVSALAGELDIDHNLVLQLVRTHPRLALLSADSSSIVAVDERDALQAHLTSLLSEGLVLKSDFVAQNDLHIDSLNTLLGNEDAQLLSFEDYVCSKAYESKIVGVLSDLLQQSIQGVQAVNIVSQNLPGGPPTWFTLRTLKHALESPNLTDKFSIQENDDSISCTPKRVIEKNRDAVTSDLQSGALAYLNLREFLNDFPELFSSYEDVHRYFEHLSDVTMMDWFAVSSVWMSKHEEDCVRILEQDGYVDTSQRFDMKLPDSLRDRVAQKAEQSIFATFEQRPQHKLCRVGSLVLTERRRNEERDTLIDHAKVDAAAQWQQLKDDAQKQIKFSLTSIAAMLSKEPIQAALIKEKGVEKALDEQFWTAVCDNETRNEAGLSAFWIDRVASRCHIYNEGMGEVQDQRLRDQLAELFASYAQKDLVPDSITKARSQGLVLSRKSRKNISRLEAILKPSPMDTKAVVTALDKFNKKQGIEAPTPMTLSATKKAMVDDMLRRMQKQKPSDGPVLFLTLVLILFAKQYSGMVYATGKFAPKLLKELKGSLEAEQYVQVEKWKEAAKTSTLSAEDRQEMVKMAQA
ncbi:hypothetical protein EJ02DRAFT_449747 [Clathrospora elynae]|uniref:Uncharacterized protein n=1 Tax=Clathrospora elynae TaxID=706981 RepID=A0A6A5TE30_9PLEO|nr:hypothetical protein EJ02DRAFT_449747 [Clathrospora elynae]